MADQMCIRDRLWLGQEAHYNYGKIVFSRASSEPNPDYPRWNRKRIEDVVWDMLMSGYLDCSEIIDPVVKFEDSAEGICTYMDKEQEKSINCLLYTSFLRRKRRP